MKGLINWVNCLFGWHDPDPIWPMFSTPQIACRNCSKKRKNGRWAG